jgi:hypothetical protein
MIVAEVSYEPSDPTVDSQIVTLKASGADTFFNVSTPKFAAQAIRKSHDIGWQPLHIINNVASSVGAVMTPAGLDKSVGLITALYLKDPTDPQWAKDPGMQRWRDFMGKQLPGADVSDFNYVYGYGAAQLMTIVLKACGDDLSRESLLKQATSLKDVTTDVTLPGIKYNTGPEDYFLVEQLQLARFDGKRWALFGEVIGHEWGPRSRPGPRFPGTAYGRGRAGVSRPVRRKGRRTAAGAGGRRSRLWRAAPGATRPRPPRPGRARRCDPPSRWSTGGER